MGNVEAEKEDPGKTEPHVLRKKEEKANAQAWIDERKVAVGALLPKATCNSIIINAHPCCQDQSLGVPQYDGVLMLRTTMAACEFGQA